MYHYLVHSGQEDVSSLILMTLPVVSQPVWKEKVVVGQHPSLFRLAVGNQAGLI